MESTDYLALCNRIAADLDMAEDVLADLRHYRARLADAAVLSGISATHVAVALGLTEGRVRAIRANGMGIESSSSWLQRYPYTDAVYVNEAGQPWSGPEDGERFIAFPLPVSADE